MFLLCAFVFQVACESSIFAENAENYMKKNAMMKNMKWDGSDEKGLEFFKRTVKKNTKYQQNDEICPKKCENYLS